MTQKDLKNRTSSLQNVGKINNARNTKTWFRWFSVEDLEDVLEETGSDRNKSNDYKIFPEIQ